MKFVDEAIIKVTAGKGGDGVASFRREKFIPFGGPNGGDGGDGGSVFLKADDSINTLVDFRYQREHRAKSGEKGGGQECTGRSGEDLIIPVPVGTLVYDIETQELLGDLKKKNQLLKVAQGGFHGLGNTRFKSSVNRAPRQCTKGKPGEIRKLKLELKVLADVGLLGLPNAGKSTFIRAVSAAKPKVADYPFTTLYPNLGVVSVSPHRSFVIADIPGLIEGAAEGAGLGIQFLKHLQRTHVLLHIVDVAPQDETDPVVSAKQIINEMKKFDADLVKKPRWLVLNKTDLLHEKEAEKEVKRIIKELAWKGPVYRISALAGVGTASLVSDLIDFIEKNRLEGAILTL